jgi:hypothetical protein
VLVVVRVMLGEQVPLELLDRATMVVALAAITVDLTVVVVVVLEAGAET